MEKYNVNITLRNNRQHGVGEPVYITGNFNGWDPCATLLGTLPASGEEETYLLCGVEEGDLEFKLTRGDWGSIGTTDQGKLEDFKTVFVNSHTDIKLDVNGWRDEFPECTASPQVHVLDSHFYFPALGVHRKVWIYLPEGYQQQQEHYPVLYMHDGQHLFDEATSRGRIGPVEWCVDEVIDEADKKVIVVAVDHAADYKIREREYHVHNVAGVTNAQGWDYLEDIVQVLKPYIDTHYRTLPDRLHTAIAGSSLGGLLNIFAGLRYPHIFGSVGVLSPSIWLDRDGLMNEITYFQAAESKPDVLLDQQYYFYCGENENRKVSDTLTVPMVDDMLAVIVELKRTKSLTIEQRILPAGRHGALYWQKEFPNFYYWWLAQMNR